MRDGHSKIRQLLLVLSLVAGTATFADPAVKLLPSDPQILYSRAKQSYTANELEGVPELLEQLANHYSKYNLKNRTHYLRGIALLNQKRYSEAVSVWRTLANVSLSDDERVYSEYHLSIALLHQKKYAAALEILQTFPRALVHAVNTEFKRACDQLGVTAEWRAGNHSPTSLFRGQIFGTLSRRIINDLIKEFDFSLKPKDDFSWTLNENISSQTRIQAKTEPQLFTEKNLPPLFDVAFDLPEPEIVKLPPPPRAITSHTLAELLDISTAPKFEIEIGTALGYLAFRQTTDPDGTRETDKVDLLVNLAARFPIWDAFSVTASGEVGLVKLGTSDSDFPPTLQLAVDFGYRFKGNDYGYRLGMGLSYQSLVGQIAPALTTAFGPAVTQLLDWHFTPDFFTRVGLGAGLCSAAGSNLTFSNHRVKTSIQAGWEIRSGWLDSIMLGASWEIFQLSPDATQIDSQFTQILFSGTF